ncbi:MAG: GTPase [Planctomycetota bacterium]
MAKKILIMGAGGKDFHVFNTLYRDNPDYQLVAFTAAQIPGIDKRTYPAQLAGKLYPQGIPILPERDMPEIVKENKVDLVIFAYSDVTYDYIKERERLARQAGADFITPPPLDTMLKSQKPVVSVCAVRTGAGKSPVSRYVVKILNEKGKKVGVVRHPMPYGDLALQEVQKFVTIEDMKQHDCTIEEMEEYEPHIENGAVIFVGVDNIKLLKELEKESDIILWDGGNNDLPFFKPDVHIVIADALRPGHEVTYYPGFENFRLANIIIISKVDQAKPEDIAVIEKNISKHNPEAVVLRSKLRVTVADQSMIKGKRVLVVEDGPTTTHGGMKFGAGVVAARNFGAKEMIDPRPFVVGTIKETFEHYKTIGTLLPAVGYSHNQVADLEKTINATDAETVIIATPIDLTRIIKINKPTVRVNYEFEETGTPLLKDVLPSMLGIA